MKPNQLIHALQADEQMSVVSLLNKVALWVQSEAQEHFEK